MNIYEKLKDYIENIEQLGADARYENNNENYELLRTKLESIKYWSEKAIKVIDKNEELKQNERK